MKTKINFLAMMLMGILLSTNVWGETYTKVTSDPGDWSGEYLLVYEESSTNGHVFTGIDAAPNNAAAAISSGSITSSEYGAYEIILATITGGYSVRVSSSNSTNANKYMYGKHKSDGSADNGLLFDETAMVNTISFDNGSVKFLYTLNEATTYFLWNNMVSGSGGQRFRYYKLESNKTQQGMEQYLGFAMYKKEATCTTDLAKPVVTATAGNGSATLTWGAVTNATSYTVTCAGATIGSVTGTTTKTCQLTGLTNGTQYTWKVKAIGGGEYCDSEEASGNVTPSANHTVTWYVDGFEYTAGGPTTNVVHGSKVATLPTQPAVPTACAGSVFVGWTDRAINNGTDTQPSVLFKDAAGAPTVNADVTYHAVFAEED